MGDELMKREIRYMVLKLKDAVAALTYDECKALDAMHAKIEAHRKARGAKMLKCVVVESDWPEYEPTWAAIAARMDGQPNAERLLPADRRRDAGKQDALVGNSESTKGK